MSILSGQGGDVSIDNPTSLFGELVTIERTPIIELKSMYGLSALRDIVTLLGGATVINVDGEFRIDTTSGGTSAAILDSAERGRYIPGQVAQMGIGVRADSTAIGSQTARWGYFDLNDGFGFGVDGTGVFIFDRSDGNETIVRQGSWNADNMDGNGPSGLTLAISRGYVYQVVFSWYGYGTVEYRIVSYDEATREQKTVVVHRIRKEGQVSVEDPNLPVRASVENNGVVNPYILCVTGREYSTYGKFVPNRRITGQYRLELGGINTTFLPSVSFRRKSDFESVAVKTSGFSVISDKDLLIQLRLNGTLTGAAFNTPSDYSAAETALEADMSATGISDGETIYEDLLGASGAGSSKTGFQIIDVPAIDFIALQPITLVLRRVSGMGSDATATVVLRASEEW